MAGNGDGRHFLLVYLNTGNGHKAQAEVLQEAFFDHAPAVKTELLSGFDRRNRAGRLLLETGYGIACNYIHGAWPLIYNLGKLPCFQKIVRFAVRLHTLAYLQEQLEQKAATDVVSFHFVLTPILRDAIRRIRRKTGRKIRLTVIATDPFTGPSAWFYLKNEDYLLSSPKFRDFALKCGVPQKNLRIVPFLLNKKFSRPATKDEIAFLRRKYGYQQDKRVVLLAGGGEGLPGALKLVKQCVLNKAPFSIAVVCGRNRGLYCSLELLQKLAPHVDLHLYGFVDYMDSLIKLSDMIVSKAGSSSLMEIAAQHKPVIISSYIYGQEKGNLEFVKKAGIGSFIRRPVDIYRQIQRTIGSDEAYEQAAAGCKTRVIDTDVAKIVECLLNTGKTK